MRKQGLVENIIKEKGFGFIRDKKNNQYFFHKSMLKKTADWPQLQTGSSVEFKSVRSQKKDKGMEAKNITLARNFIPFTSINDIPGRYGLITIEQGQFSSLSKEIFKCDGLAFGGSATFGGRFPRNSKMIELLKEMHAVFDKYNKIWFLPANKVPANLVRIYKLTKIAKSLQRMKTIGAFFTGIVSAITAIVVGSAVMMVGMVFVVAMLFIFVGAINRPLVRVGGMKISKGGNVWVNGFRL